MKKKFIVIALVSALLTAGIMGSSFLNVSHAAAPTGPVVYNPPGCGSNGSVDAGADACPDFVPGVSVSGDTITISGNYSSGIGTVDVPCVAGDVYLPEGFSTNGITYSINDGSAVSNVDIPYTVNKSATTGTCDSNPVGQPEEGTFSYSFVDNNLSPQSTIVLTYKDSGGNVGSETFSNLVAPAPVATVSLSAVPNTIALGNSTNLIIKTTNVASCVGSGANDGGWTGPEPTGGPAVTETPGALGVAKFTITCKGSAGGNVNATALVKVNPAPAGPVGTITVNSDNSVNINYPQVSAKWDLFDGAGPNNVCDENGVECQGTSQKYLNQPAPGLVTMSSIALLNNSPYAFNSIKLVPIAPKKIGIVDEMLALTRTMIVSTAEAWSVPPGNPLTQHLLPGKTVNFIILWDPIANIAVAPTPLPLTADAGASTSGQVQVTNTGAPGSTLAWTSNIVYTGGNGNGWLSLSRPVGLTNAAMGNASQNVTVSADASKLSKGTYTATVNLTGTSAPGVNASDPSPKASFTVVFTVNNGGGNPPPGDSITGVTVNCNPSPNVPMNTTSNCTATVHGNGSYSTGVAWSTDNGSVSATGNDTATYSAPATAGSANVKACSTDPNYPTQCGSVTLTITGGSGPQLSCSSLTADPASIVVPESSNLTYSCLPAAGTSCLLTGGGSQWTPGANGNVSVAPTSTTLYTLNCTNKGATAQSTAEVTVGGSTYCEQNPNGVGCPGQ